jgi:voltage-gated potassium channel
MNGEKHRRYHRKLSYIFVILALALSLGTVAYHYMEKWNYVDSLYFSAATMTTVGYGDFVPKTDEGKLFAVFYMFAGVGIALYSLSIFASHFVELRQEFWLHRIENLKIGQRTGTIFGKLKNALSYKNNLPLKENINSQKILQKTGRKIK